MKNFLLFPLMLILSHCTPSTPVTPDTSGTPNLVWQTPLGERGSSIHPIISGDYVVFSNEKSTTPTTEPLNILNKKTGKLIGEWNDILGTGGDIYDSEGRGIYEHNGIMVLPLGSRVHAIDVKNNKTLWKNKDSDAAEEGITGIGNAIFHSKYKNINGIESGYVAKGNILTGTWETVFTDTTLSDYRNTLQTPIPFIDKNNDTLLFIVQTKYRFPPQERKIDNLYCFNLSKRQLKYKIPITEPTGSVDRSIVYYPQIEGDKIVIRSGNKLLCFNIYSSNKIWEVENNDQQLSSSWRGFVLGNGKVFAYSSGASVVCFDLTTGSQIWKLPTNNGNLISGMAYFNGYLYYSTGGLQAINANTGQRIWDYSSPAKEFFDLNIRVDKAESKLYISDFKGNMYCFEALK